MDNGVWNNLVTAALEVQQNAYARYSQFPVAAALLAKSGATYRGVNVENASSGLTVCAERNAVAAAIVAGEREFVALVVVLPGGGTPCGACRQVLVEFCPDLPILLVDSDAPENRQSTTLAALFPSPFASSRLV